MTVAHKFSLINPMKNPLFLLVFCLSLITPIFLSAQGGGKVFAKATDVPRLTKTPVNINLQPSPNSDRIFSVRASLGEIRLGGKSSRGDAGGTGRLNTFKKFVRVDIRGITRLTQPKTVKVEYQVIENNNSWIKKDVVKINKSAPNLVIDCYGYKDVFGSEVKTKTTSTTITSTKYKHAEADIKSVYITIYGDNNHLLYSGAWPRPPYDEVRLPERLRPRTFTSGDGKQLKGSVTGIDAENVSLMINSKTFVVPRSSLTKADQDYLTKAFSPADYPPKPQSINKSIGLKKGRYVRIDLAIEPNGIQFAELEVFSGGVNVAINGTATQSSIYTYKGVQHATTASKAIDGNTNGLPSANSICHTNTGKGHWWEVDLGEEKVISGIAMWSRTDQGARFAERMDGSVFSILDESRATQWSHKMPKAPKKTYRIQFSENFPEQVILQNR